MSCDLKTPPPTQATAFLLCGFLVMFGSITLIILDWVNNSSGAPNDGH